MEIIVSNGIAIEKWPHTKAMKEDLMPFEASQYLDSICYGQMTWQKVTYDFFDKHGQHGTRSVWVLDGYLHEFGFVGIYKLDVSFYYGCFLK